MAASIRSPFSPYRDTSDDQPEGELFDAQKLCYAIIERAMRDYLHTPDGVSDEWKKWSEHISDAADWFLEKRHEPFSYSYCCDALNMPTEKLFKRMDKQRPFPRPLPRHWAIVMGEPEGIPVPVRLPEPTKLQKLYNKLNEGKPPIKPLPPIDWP